MVLCPLKTRDPVSCNDTELQNAGLPYMQSRQTMAVLVGEPKEWQAYLADCDLHRFAADPLKHFVRSSLIHSVSEPKPS